MADRSTSRLPCSTSPMIRRLAANLLFLPLTVVAFWGVFFGGQTLVATDFLENSPVWRPGESSVRNPWLSDSIEYYYPCERIYSEHARRGELPLVNPYL